MSCFLAEYAKKKGSSFGFPNKLPK